MTRIAWPSPAELPESSAEEFQAVIAGSFFRGDICCCARSDDLKLALAENQIVVTYHDTDHQTAAWMRNFLNYRQLLPDLATRVSMDGAPRGRRGVAAGADQLFLAGASFRHQIHGVADRAAVRRRRTRALPGDAVVRGRKGEDGRRSSCNYAYVLDTSR